jgi:hypothetical protein
MIMKFHRDDVTAFLILHGVDEATLAKAKHCLDESAGEDGTFVSPYPLLRFMSQFLANTFVRRMMHLRQTREAVFPAQAPFRSKAS